MRTFDPKKPRFRKDKGTTIKIVSKVFFKKYRKKYKTSSIDTYVKMRNVLAVLHEKITDIIATERGGFDLAQLANIVTVAYTPYTKTLQDKHKYIDYSLSKNVDKVVKYTNLHTDGKACRIYFSMELPKYKFLYRRMWGFTPTLPFRRKVSREFSNNYLRFIEVERGESMRKIFQTAFQ